MKITAIKQQVKTQRRYSIFVDDKYALSLSEGALLEAKLQLGQELTGQALKDLKQASADDKIYNNALRYAALRSRSTWEMESYLQRKYSPAPLVKKILNKLSDIGMLNDEAFARNWVANRSLLKPSSTRKLRLELRQKRVPDEIINRVLTEEEAPRDQATLQEVIARKRRQTKYQDDQKLMQYLARQGFNYDDIKSALAEKGRN